MYSIIFIFCLNYMLVEPRFLRPIFGVTFQPICNWRAPQVQSYLNFTETRQMPRRFVTRFVLVFFPLSLSEPLSIHASPATIAPCIHLLRSKVSYHGFWRVPQVSLFRKRPARCASSVFLIMYNDLIGESRLEFCMGARFGHNIRVRPGDLFCKSSPSPEHHCRYADAVL
jgi:hypothetical protein